MVLTCTRDTWPVRRRDVGGGDWGADALALCSPLPASFPGCPYDFVSLEWLQQWLDESTPPKAIDNTAFLCTHGKLNPDKIPTVKRVSEDVADYFYKRYGGGPRLTGGQGDFLEGGDGGVFLDEASSC